MKTPEQKINSALDQLSAEIDAIQDNSKLWMTRYLYDHRNRFVHDLSLILNLRNNEDILEIGSAPFQLLYCLKQLHVNAVGVDLDPGRASGFIERNDLNVLQCDIEKEQLIFNDNSQKLIVFNETIEHLRINPLFTLREIARVLHTDGQLILTTPNLYSIKNVVRFLTGKGLNNTVKEYSKLETIGHMGHVREYSRKELFALLDHCGFKVKRHDFIHYKTGRFITRIIYSVFPFFRPYQLVIAVVK